MSNTCQGLGFISVNVVFTVINVTIVKRKQIMEVKMYKACLYLLFLTIKSHFNLSIFNDLTVPCPVKTDMLNL